MPTPFTHFTQSALSLRNFTQLYTALRILTHFTHFTQSSKTLGTLRFLRNLRELACFTQLYSALRKAKILYATLRGGETLYASFTRRLRKVHLLYAHFTHTLRNFTQFKALYARPDYFTQLYAHGNLLMSCLLQIQSGIAKYCCFLMLRQTQTAARSNIDVPMYLFWNSRRRDQTSMAPTMTCGSADRVLSMNKSKR